jgi:hypothetical protein
MTCCLFCLGHDMDVTGINHIACRTPDVARLKAFKEELLGAEPLAGSHDPLRVGTVILVFFESARASVGDDPDEIAFDADAASFAAILGRARAMDVVTQDLVEPTPWSRALLSATPTAAASRSLTTTTASLARGLERRIRLRPVYGRVLSQSRRAALLERPRRVADHVQLPAALRPVAASRSHP